MTRPVPPVDPETLLANAGWVRALARSLVRDEHAAEDVTQEAWVAALERPPRPGVPLPAWLARVTRNLALNARRAAGRRVRRAEAAPPAEAPRSPEESVARAEMFEIVVREVLALEPIHRDVVILRFFDGLEMPEVAARLGVPFETARTRLKRALGVLRDRLDRRCGGRDTWAVVLLGPHALGRPTAPRPLPAAGVPGAVAAAVGGAIVLKTFVAAAVVVLLLAGAWFGVRAMRPDAAEAPPETSALAAPDGSAAARARSRSAGAATEASEAPADEPRATQARPARWVLRGRIQGIEPADAARAALSVYVAHTGTSEMPAPLAASATSGGTYEVDVTTAVPAAHRVTEIAVVVEHPDCLRGVAETLVAPDTAADASGTAVLQCDVTLRRAAILTVRVVDADGAPLAGSQVASYSVRERQPEEFVLDESTTDASGTARLRLAPGEPHLVLAAAPDFAPAVALVAGGARDSVTVLVRRGVSVEGRVTEAGLPVAGAEIVVSPEGWQGRWLHLAGETRVYWDAGTVYATDVRATTDARGAWRATGLTPGRHRVVVERIGERREPFGYLRIADVPAHGVDFEIAVGQVVVLVSSTEGPVAGARLSVFAGGGAHPVTTDAEGRATFEIAAGGEHRIQVDCDGYLQTFVEFTGPELGARVDVSVTMEAIPAHGSLTVIVRDPDGRPIARTGLALFPPGAAVTTAGRVEHEHFGNAADGRFTVTEVGAGPWRLGVRPGRHWQPDWSWDGDAGTWLDEVLDIEIPATGEKEIVVVARPGGRLRIAARDEAGMLLPAAVTVRDAAGQTVAIELATRYGSGAHSLGGDHLDVAAPSDVATAFPPGRYRVELSLEGYETRVIDAEVEAGKTCLLDTTLRGPAGARPRPVPVPVPESRPAR